MRKRVIFVISVALVLGIAASAVAKHHAVKIRHSDQLGNYFTDTEGMTLYWFKKDSPSVSVCAGPCLEKWPIYFRPTVAAPAGVNESDFATITREDGKQQTTFRGYPLYYFFNDKKPGDTTGQGVNNIWYVIDPGNFPPR